MNTHSKTRALAIIKTWGTLMGFLLLLLVFSSLRPDVFPSGRNMKNIIEQVATLAIVASGVTVVMVTGDFDLIGRSHRIAGGSGCRPADEIGAQHTDQHTHRTASGNSGRNPERSDYRLRRAVGVRRHPGHHDSLRRNCSSDLKGNHDLRPTREFQSAGAGESGIHSRLGTDHGPHGPCRLPSA